MVTRDRRFIILKEIRNWQVNLIGDKFPLGFKVSNKFFPNS